MIREEIEKLIKKSLSNLGIENTQVSLEHPADLAMGDYSTNVAMVLAKTEKKNPVELAQKIVEEISTRSDLGNSKRSDLWLEKVEAKNGFINFYLSKEFFASSLKEILEKGEDFGKNESGKGKKIIVEYSSPNIAKPFTVGHLRSTIIGDAVANLLAFSGYEVLRDNHLGDWGTQFGKMIVAIKKYGNEAEIEKSAQPVRDLVALYVKFHEEAEKDPALEDEAREWFTKLEMADPEARRIWQKCVDLSMVEFDRMYKMLGVKFDMSLGESFFEDKMIFVIKDLEKKDFYRESEGAKLVFFPDEKYPPLMIEKKDGSTLYATRDLATDKYRKEEWNPDIIINEVGAEQSLYFEQIFETEKMLGYFKDGQRVHVAHGLYRFKEGKMSTRKGNVIWLDDILTEAIERASKINENTGASVGIGAIKFNDLKSEAKKDIIFNWEDILNIEGDTGPYVQYAFVRTRSVLAKASEQGEMPNTLSSSETIFDIEKLLYRFPEVVEESGRLYAPHKVAQYLLTLAHEFNSFYGKNKILETADTSYKLALVTAVGHVLQNGLHLLGIETPEKM